MRGQWAARDLAQAREASWSEGATAEVAPRQRRR